MTDSSTKFNQLLDIKQVLHLLKSIVEIAPYILFMVDLEDNVLVQAAPDDISPQLIDKLHDTIKVDALTNLVEGKPYEEARAPVDIRGRLVGYIIGITFDTVSQSSQNLAVTTQLISQVLVDLADKEYELHSLSMELLSRYEEITLLYELGQSLGSVFDIPTICDIALDMSFQIIKAKDAYISLIDEDGQYLTVVASRGTKRGFVGWKVPVGQGISGYVASTGEQVLLEARSPSVRGITRELETDPPKKLEPSEAILSVPLVLPMDQITDEGGVLGVVTMTGRPPGEMFTAGDAKLLTTIATQISIAIHNSRLVHALREAERVQQQIKIAADIQQSLLPKHPPQVPGIELFGQCIPAANVGGDYFDFFTDEAGRLTLLIADVSGHSIGTALMMATARSTLRLEIALGKSLAGVMTDANRSLFEDLAQAEMFISVFCARYDPQTQTLTYVNAGHNPPLLQRTAETVIELDTDGLILGVLDDVIYEEKTVVLQPGDILALYTDGAVEARSPGGIQFGDERFYRILARNSDYTPAEITQRIYEAINQFTEHTPQQDDITLLLLKVMADAESQKIP